MSVPARLIIIWRDTNSGMVAIWLLANDMHVQSVANVAVVPPSSTGNIVQIGDYNGDGFSDLLWLTEVAIWQRDS